MPIGHCETLNQVVDGLKFLIHCQKEKNYVAKMSSHGILTIVDDHYNFHNTTNADGSRLRIKFNHPKSSCHNRAKHWVDDSNNCKHDPIASETGLEF